MRDHRSGAAEWRGMVCKKTSEEEEDAGRDGMGWGL